MQALRTMAIAAGLVPNRGGMSHTSAAAALPPHPASNTQIHGQGFTVIADPVLNNRSRLTELPAGTREI
ncbi:hypothetical protein XGA_2238 [Xanthomonas hortorum ATCC 19865]|nr:hypothetical protein XGA_2238 [Xanthomonas hortorum ATCC 19865]